MKTHHLISSGLLLALLLPIIPHKAAALSCLPIDIYLKDVVGNSEIVIFEGTAIDRIEETSYTAEVVNVSNAKQGWVEDTLFVYHEKHPDWGYLCNNGPKANGTKSIYIASRNDQNQYFIHQRLDHTDPLVTRLNADLKAADSEGGVSDITKTDRMNQIMTAIVDLFSQITILLKEYSYWKQ